MRTKTTSNWKVISLIVGVALCINVNAQDIHFSQFYEAPLDLNPALCGAFPGQIYGELNYRSQWSSVMGNGYGFNTMGATFEYHNLLKKWDKGYLSPGLNFFNDKSGDGQIGITQINFTLASGIFLNDKNSLAVGLQAGWAQHSINMANLQWDNQYINGAYDPNAPSGEQVGNTFSYLDFAAGILYSYGTGQTNMTSNDQIKANVGGAVYHLSQPQMSYYAADDGAFYITNGTNNQNGTATKLYMRYVINANLQYGVPNSNIGIVPTFVFYQQGPAQEIDFGSKFRYILRQESKYTGIAKGSAFDLGVYYRWKDAAILLVGMEFGSYALGISYDVNTSGLTTASSGRGGFEISLRFINPNPFMGGTESGTTTKSMF
ncbi:MAG TPA: PorP/SprF family type IX secretion system membrane protein [Bacteroidia bacterium]|jgi:type IX secretion system PorP/SprF family membrane protein|nr:PorP/SprF family type IX secretion system membrane protein [Bacteroidia bacterium]